MRPAIRRKQQGAMLISSAIFFILLIGIAALAIDVGHLLVARNELQNAADAAALAGANCLDKTTDASGTDCTSTTSASINWSIAAAKATAAIGSNKADGTALTSGTVTTGYKSMNSAIGSSGALQPISLSPVGPCLVAGGPCDKPAVMVTIRKDTGLNGGPVQTLITAMFGGAPAAIQASAIAVISSPASVPPGSVIPIAINKCVYDAYWDSSSNSPRLATTNPLMMNGIAIPQVIGQPWEIRIGSSYHFGTCGSGQWTTFAIDSNAASVVKSLIQSGNPGELSIGDMTWLKPGSTTSNYNNMDAQYPTPLTPDTANASHSLDVLMPVVDVTDLSSSTNAQYPIIAFGSFHIDDVEAGADKYIQGHFIPALTAPGSSGIGPSYGAYTPPRIAQ